MVLVYIFTLIGEGFEPQQIRLKNQDADAKPSIGEEILIETDFERTFKVERVMWMNLGCLIRRPTCVIYLEHFKVRDVEERDTLLGVLEKEAGLHTRSS